MKSSLKYKGLMIVLAVIVIFSGFRFSEDIWGFYGHRKINRMAVYCLPEEMINIFKENIDFISEHAVDPDKRRYASPFEAVRHYIDIDHWGEKPFETVPRNYYEAVAKFGRYYLLHGKDTIFLNLSDEQESKEYQNKVVFVRNNWLIQRYEEVQSYSCDSLVKYFDFEPGECAFFRFDDEFSTYGILPFELERYQYRLRDAFIKKDVNEIIRLATDMGHYIGDAHVPLHTTENYNGQLTNQVGIHAFWESRLPELFADEEYDFLVGQAEYIDNPKDYFWRIVEKSFSYVDDVFAIEKEISREFSRDQQYCYEERLSQTVRMECEAYARRYHDLMGGMVEERMRESVKAVADCWFTAWVDAGQPEFRRESVINQWGESIENAFKTGRILGRDH